MALGVVTCLYLLVHTIALWQICKNRKNQTKYRSAKGNPAKKTNLQPIFEMFERNAPVAKEDPIPNTQDRLEPQSYSTSYARNTELLFRKKIRVNMKQCVIWEK